MCDERKGDDIQVLKVSHLCSFTDCLVLATGNSSTHVNALSDAIQRRLKRLGQRPLGVEGGARTNWLLLDYGDVVAHVFLQEAREYYNIERLWGDAEAIEWRETSDANAGREV